MRTSTCQIIGTKCVLCFVAVVLTAFSSTQTLAQVNSWTNPTSGSWDDPSSWSLGIPPDSSQSVQITNSGWKAVVINPSTPLNSPGSMTVNDLTIRGATNTENTLLLNYFGIAVPLTVLNGLTLQDGAQLLNFDSCLLVQSGMITVTNSQINQDGGVIITTNAQMNLSDAQYQLTNGVFEGGIVWIGAPSYGQFNQYGGTATIATLKLATPVFSGSGSYGSYSLYGGNLNLPGGLSLRGEYNSVASYFQSGGTNQTTELSIEPGIFGTSPFFTLNGGLLADNNVDVVGDNFGPATLEQNGGIHKVSNILHIAGGASSISRVEPATYSLIGGTLSAQTIKLDATEGDAAFDQTNGNTQAGEIQASSGTGQTYWVTTVNFSGGTLSCSNLSVTDGGSIHQDGGALTVSNTLSIFGYRQPGPTLPTTYEFRGGTLFASNIIVGGEWIIGDTAALNQITNSGFCSLSGTLQIGNAVEQLGRFILAGNATMNLAGNASQLSFTNSSGETWAAGATLVVTNWNGNPSGGGTEQLRFGTDQSGLTLAQLSHIHFSIASSTNFFPAKILNTGEVVPDTGSAPTVALSTVGNSLVLTWPQGWSLQTATNVAGPYLDMTNATSPYTSDTTAAPQQFFRLRQQTE